MGDDYKKLKLSGSILGVPFDLTLLPAENGGEITGEAGGKPVQIKFMGSDDGLNASGTLLGNEFSITGVEAD